MRILYTPNHIHHNPQFEIFNGNREEHQEIPDRIENIKQRLEQEGLSIYQGALSVPLDLLQSIHEPSYIRFIHDSEFAYPSVFEIRAVQMRHPELNNLSQRGFYSFDMFTPILNGTYQAAFDSASLAYEGAVLLQKNPGEVVYALCRPPGHHAEYNQMGGYCYFNNCCVAAEYLSQFGRVATLDVDFHHGNGTQNIFYSRNSIFTVSLHADPAWKFPYFCGFANETGSDEGEGYNLNIPLAKGTDNNRFQQSLELSLDRIAKFAPDYLVVSLGLDTHVSDPIGGFALTTEYYTQMARTIKSSGLPILVVQEGGYNNEYLGINAHAFLKGLA